MATWNGLTAVVEEMTPAKAEAALAGMVRNRVRRARAVEQYGRDMVAGQWEVNGEPVIFSKTGALLDGQHRLAACVERGVSFKTLVVRGVDEKVFDSLGLGRVRTAADVFGMSGEIEATVLSSALKLVLSWEKGRPLTATDGMMVTPRELEAVLARNPELRGSVVRIVGSKALKRLLPPSIASALHYIGSKTQGVEKADVFWEMVSTGANLSYGHPALVLRERLSQVAVIISGNRSVKISRTMRLAYAIKAWNAYIEGKAISLLRYNREEKFPEML